MNGGRYIRFGQALVALTVLGVVVAGCESADDGETSGTKDASGSSNGPERVIASQFSDLVDVDSCVKSSLRDLPGINCTFSDAFAARASAACPGWGPDFATDKTASVYINTESPAGVGEVGDIVGTFDGAPADQHFLIPTQTTITVTKPVHATILIATVTGYFREDMSNEDALKAMENNKCDPLSIVRGTRYYLGQ